MNSIHQYQQPQQHRAIPVIVQSHILSHAQYASSHHLITYSANSIRQSIVQEDWLRSRWGWWQGGSDSAGDKEVRDQTFNYLFNDVIAS